jgi:acyl dehydratase
MTATGWEWEGRSLLERSDLAEVRVRSRGRTITDADFSAMTNLTWTTSELHTNEALMAEGAFGSRILAGACVVAFALGLATPAVRPELMRRGIRFVALLGYNDVRFRSPLRPGATIYVESEVIALQGTSRAGRATVSFAERVVTHDGDVLATYTRTALCEGTFGGI